EKRQKIILAVGCVVLLGVLAFQGPKTLKMLHGSSSTDGAQATTTTSTTTPTTAAPVTPGAPATSAVPAPGPQPVAVVAGGIGSADTSAEPTPDTGQLVSFDRFRTKDPFVQQVGGDCTASSSSGGTSCPSSTPTSTSSKSSTSSKQSTSPKSASTP